MIEIHNRQIHVDGRPCLILSGEIHYFRLRREDWQDRLDKLKAAGCNAVASYIPWLCHEPVEGQIDLQGLTRPELDLGAFIDLCARNGLGFFARPGPFVMAELKNEGLPFWLYEKHPEILPVSWDGKPVTTRTVDYLAPGFLHEARRWYAAVCAILAPRLQPRGGNVIALQLDNEIGMLSWGSRSPDLTENVLADFRIWLREHYPAMDLARRYPFDLDDPLARAHGIRSPAPGYSLSLLRDLGHYMRQRFARYVATLRGWAEEFGVRDIPFVVNVHGTAGGRGPTFPIGISQLYPAYTQAPGYLAGSDYYFGNLTLENFQDLYLCNAFLQASQLPDQPLTSVEFECGDGNYGQTFGNRLDPSAFDFKLRMCIAQGARLVNYYLFAGGRNYRLDPPPHDGNDRIAFTGERHGFAAPVSPEGELNYTFPRLVRVTRTLLAVADKLASMEEEHDRVALAFVPDYFMTESVHPENPVMTDFVRNLEEHRGAGFWEIPIRAMLLAGYRFGALDIQNGPLDPGTTPVLVLGTARYLEAAIQRKLADWLRAGGGLLLYGEVPQYDMEGRPCTLLADALGVRIEGCREAGPRYFLSLVHEGWTAPRPEVRTYRAQALSAPQSMALLRIYDTREVCGLETQVGQGRAIVLAAACPCDIALFRTALERLGACPGLHHDCPEHGIFLTSTANADGERFLHLLNLDGFGKRFHLFRDGKPLFGGETLELPAREGMLLPLGVSYHGVHIESSTAEILGIEPGAFTFRRTQPEDRIVLHTRLSILESDDYTSERRGHTVSIRSRRPAALGDRLVVRIAPPAHGA
ncbi:MAG TPA: beta-galactosidase [Methylococcus sp.]|nr:beta-galactosidase [Methylococcus sp.]